MMEAQGKTATHKTNCSYDVFLSFRGQDTRHSFTGSLYHALCRKGLKTFMDDEELKGGNQISQTLGNAIQQSRISIVVLSEGYASSTWCLDELVEILECATLKNQLVWPIFYKVAPSDVRHQRHSYAEAMTKHEEGFGDGSDRVKKWRSALSKVTDLKGWHYETGYEYEFIEDIAKKATTRLRSEKPDAGENITRHQSRIEEVKSLSDIEYDKTVCMVGIHGMGGMGKATLAKPLYSSIIHQFEYAFFFEEMLPSTSLQSCLPQPPHPARRSAGEAREPAPKLLHDLVAASKPLHKPSSSAKLLHQPSSSVTKLLRNPAPATQDPTTQPRHPARDRQCSAMPRPKSAMLHAPMTQICHSLRPYNPDPTKLCCHAMENEKKESSLWPSSFVKIFIDIMVDEVNKGSMRNKVFSPKVWQSILCTLYQRTEREYEMKQIKQKFNRLRQQHGIFSQLLQQTGFGWDAETNTVTTTKEVWSTYIRAHPDATPFKKKGLDNYKELGVIFNKSSATGVLHHSSTQDPPNMDDEIELDNTFLHDREDALQAFIESSKLKAKTMAEASKKKAEVSMVRAERYRAKSIEATSSIVASAEYTMARCITELEKMDDVSDDSYMKAVEKFKDAEYREAFLNMTGHRRKAWLDRLW